MKSNCSPYKALALAEAYEEQSAFRPALNIYQSLIKTAEVSLRVKINLGNVHFKQKNYPKAIKFYKMALDQVGQNEKVTYFMIMNNIGLALVQQRVYSEAAFVFAYIVKQNPDLKAYLHLVLCSYALRSASKIRRYFPGIFTLPRLDQIEPIERIVFLVAHFIEEKEDDGFNWCLDIIRVTDYAWIADNLEVARIVNLMRGGNFKKVFHLLDKFKFDIKHLTETSKVNLSFIYTKLSRFPQVDSLLKDCTSAKAYNNFGVLKMLQGDHSAARSVFQSAIELGEQFYELLYNMALVELKLGNVNKSEEIFLMLMKKFPFPCNPIANYQLVQLMNDRKSNFHNLQSNLEVVDLTYVTDPKVLKTIAELYRELSNFKQSRWYFEEAYSVNPLL